MVSLVPWMKTEAGREWLAKLWERCPASNRVFHDRHIASSYLHQCKCGTSFCEKSDFLWKIINRWAKENSELKSIVLGLQGAFVRRKRWRGLRYGWDWVYHYRQLKPLVPMIFQWDLMSVPHKQELSSV